MKFFVGILVGIAVTVGALYRVDVVVIRHNLPPEKASLGKRVWDLWEGRNSQPEEPKNETPR